MSKFEQLRAELERIKQEAANKERAEREARLEAERVKNEERRREREMLKENWSFLRDYVVETLRVAAKEVPETGVEITPFSTKHTHIIKHWNEYSGNTDDNFNPLSEPHRDTKQTEIEIAELSIQKKGKIFVMFEKEHGNLVYFSYSTDIKVTPIIELDDKGGLYHEYFWEGQNPNPNSLRRDSAILSLPIPCEELRETITRLIGKNLIALYQEFYQPRK